MEATHLGRSDRLVAAPDRPARALFWTSWTLGWLALCVATLGVTVAAGIDGPLFAGVALSLVFVVTAIGAWLVVQGLAPRATELVSVRRDRVSVVTPRAFGHRTREFQLDRIRGLRLTFPSGRDTGTVAFRYGSEDVTVGSGLSPDQARTLVETLARLEPSVFGDARG